MEKQNDLPLISIGVSAYNRKDYLRLSLDSLLAQTYPNCEIIVVDDGSSDGTGEMMAAEYPQIRYIYQENAGDAAAKNHAAREAHGEYIVFNDSDDLFLPDTVERLYNALPENPGNACSYVTYQTIDAEGNSLLHRLSDKSRNCRHFRDFPAAHYTAVPRYPEEKDHPNR